MSPMHRQLWTRLSKELGKSLSKNLSCRKAGLMLLLEDQDDRSRNLPVSDRFGRDQTVGRYL